MLPGLMLQLLPQLQCWTLMGALPVIAPWTRSAIGSAMRRTLRAPEVMLMDVYRFSGEGAAAEDVTTDPLEGPRRALGERLVDPGRGLREEHANANSKVAQHHAFLAVLAQLGEAGGALWRWSRLVIIIMVLEAPQVVMMALVAMKKLCWVGVGEGWLGGDGRKGERPGRCVRRILLCCMRVLCRLRNLFFLRR